MRIANLDGRLTLLTGDRTTPTARAIDVEGASEGRFDADPQRVYDRWDEFRAWARTAGGVRGEAYEPARLRSPAPRPPQVFAIGLNYSEHAAESGFAAPDSAPPVFTKFPACITGPYGSVVLPAGGHTDWEVELVVVIGRRTERVRAEDAWSCVAGLAVGQDLSERVSQMAGPAPQFSLAKSFPRFGPVGPWLVTPDEFDDPDDLALVCSLNGEVVQEGRTSKLLFGIPAILEQLSAVVPLLPGDVVFTGTPSGVGMGRVPPRWLSPGDELVSSVEGIGEMRHWFVGQEN
ncbi:MAG: fumarylacetoacetate hydrolase family protein [Blastococcus sp.]|jgi:2-keto-4-pentenoate hydratase/2-oxohepta-3-ene-1,7-dioic acid hydratase in catechol pathway|nr:fumarylacetoacetate hydrolase family protein [Blastococcus sp.]